MDGFTPNTYALGQSGNPSNTPIFQSSSTVGLDANIPSTSTQEFNNLSWTSAPVRGGGGRGNSTASRGGGRGGSTRGMVPSSRGKSFGNRSAVFNSSGQSDIADNIGNNEESMQTIKEHENQWNALSSAANTDSAFSFQQPQSAFHFEKETNFSSSTNRIAENNDDISQKPASSSFPQTNKRDLDQERKQRFENLPKQNRFFEMRAEREVLRAKYVREGVLPDPDKPTELAEAKVFTGTCMEMCPEFEREEREFQNEGDLLEMFPGTNRIDPKLAVKIYRRPAAGRELPLPEDVRPPEILRMTLDYLVYNLLPSDPKSSTFTSVQPFMWNRTRAIRQDFIVQGDGGDLAIECHERISRYHILCLHWRGGIGAEGWSEQQELEQLRKTIRSLTEFYEDMRRRKGVICPNEAEFRSYNLLLHMQDPETLREAEGLPNEILQTNCVQVALKLRAYAQRSNNVLRRGRPLNTEATMNFWTRFFGELRRNPNVTYLLACLAENVFSLVRAGALKAMGKTYNAQHAPLPLDYLKRSLGLDTEEEARSFAVELGAEEALDQNGNLIGLRLGRVNDDKPLPNAPFSHSVVEARRGRYTAQDIVDGSASGAVPLLHVEQSPFKKGNATIEVAPIKPKSKPVSQPVSFNAFTTIATSPQTDIPASAATVNTLSAKAPAFVPSNSVLKQSEEIMPGPQKQSPLPQTSSNASGFTTATAESSHPTKNTFQSSFTFGNPQTSSPSANFSAGFQATSSPAMAFGQTQKASSASSILTPPIPSSKQQSSLQENKKGADLFSSPPAISKSKPLEVSEKKKRETTKDSKGDSAFEKSISSKDTFPIANAIPTIPTKISTPLAPSAPKRTVKSVADGLARHMIEEMISKRLFPICEQACLREIRIRQSDARSLLIDDCVDGLYSMMLEDVLDDILQARASEVLADELYSRTVLSNQWELWKDALGRAHERKYQKSRLNDLRKRMQSLEYDKKASTNLDKTPNNNQRKTRNVLMEMDDNTLQNKLNEAHHNREDIWMPATFFYSIVSLFEPLLVPNIDVWTIGVLLADIGQGQQPCPSSQWLRTKLSIENEPHAEMALRSDVCIHMMDLQRCDEEDIQFERNLGLLLFELNERLTNNLSNVQEWKKERERLRTLTESNLVKNSKYFPKLMIIYWGEADTKEAGEKRFDDTMRKMIVKRLGLGAMDFVRHAWSQVDFWNAARSGSSPQKGFETHLQSLLAPIEFSIDHRIITLEDVVTICSTAWRSTLDRIQACINRAAQIEENFDIQKDNGQSEVRQKLLELVSFAFEITTILTQKVISNVVSVSDVVLDENVYDEEESIPIHPYKMEETGKDSMIDIAFYLASKQLSLILSKAESQNKDEASISLIKTWLTEQKRARHQSLNTFPWFDYFVRILYIYIEDLQSRWIDIILSSIEEVEKFIESSNTAFQEAAIEVETRLKSLLIHKSLQYTNQNKRRNGKDSFSGQDAIDVDDDNDRPMNKMRKTEINHSRKIHIEIREDSHNNNSERVEPIPKSINSLKNLIASANKLLEEKSE